MIYLIAGARPNFLKIAPIAKSLKKRAVSHKVIHTGQHYDEEMSGTFFQDLGLTLRHNTERPITIKEGTNKLVGNDPDMILREAMGTMAQEKSRKKLPKYWDGKAAERIVKILSNRHSTKKR